MSDPGEKKKQEQDSRVWGHRLLTEKLQSEKRLHVNSPADSTAWFTLALPNCLLCVLHPHDTVKSYYLLSIYYVSGKDIKLLFTHHLILTTTLPSIYYLQAKGETTELQKD